MTVIRLRAGEACQECGGQTNLPHMSLHDCLDSLDRELSDALARAHAINRARTRILAKRMEGLKHTLRKTDLTPRDRKARQQR